MYPMLMADQPENLDACWYNLNDALNDPHIFQAKAYDLIHSLHRCRHQRQQMDIVHPRHEAASATKWLIQIVEYYLNIQSSSGRLTDDSAVRRWWNKYAEAMSRMNRDPRIGNRLQSLFVEAKLGDVRVETLQLPIGDWEPGKQIAVAEPCDLVYIHNVQQLMCPEDPVKASIGRDAVVMMGDLLESLSLWPLTQQLNYTVTEFQRLIREVRVELQDKDLKLYVPV